MKASTKLTVAAALGVSLAILCCHAPSARATSWAPEETTHQERELEDVEVYYEEATYHLIVYRNFSRIPQILSNVSVVVGKMAGKKTSAVTIQQKVELCKNRTMRRIRDIERRLEELREEDVLAGSWSDFPFWEETFGQVGLERTREKREIKWLSSAWKWASGAPDADDWQENLAAIAEIIKTENQHGHLFKMITDEEEGILQAVNKTEMLEVELDQRLTSLHAHEKQTVLWMKALVEVDLVCGQCEEILDEADGLMREAERVQAHARTDNLSPAMVKKEKLKDTLDSIPRMEGLVPLWPKTDAHHYYANGLTNTIHRNLVFVSQLRIPMVNSAKKMRMFPTSKDSGEKILLDGHHSSYRYLTPGEMNKCDKMKGSEMVCRGRGIYIKDATQLCRDRLDCALGRSLPYDRVVEIDTDTIGYRFKEELTVWKRCQGEKAASILLNRTGAIVVPPHCSLAGGDFEVHRRTNARSDIQLVVEEWELEIPEEQFKEELRIITGQLEDLETGHKNLSKLHSTHSVNISGLRADLDHLEDGIARERDELNNGTLLTMEQFHLERGELETTRVTHDVALGSGISVVTLLMVALAIWICCHFTAFKKKIRGINVNLGIGVPARGGDPERGMEMS